MSKYIAVCDYEVPCLNLLPPTKSYSLDIFVDINYQKEIQYSIEKEIWVQLQRTLANYREEDCIFLVECEELKLSDVNQRMLLNLLYDSINYDVKMLFGNAGSFGQLIPLSDNILWVDYVGYSSYVVIFKVIYDEIINYNINDFKGFWNTLNILTSQKLLLHPFIFAENCVIKQGFEDSETKVNQIIAVQKRLSKFRQRNSLF